MKKVFISLITVLVLFTFFSYKLTQIPDGINGDEASFGYNATLLSRNLRDETGRHYPIFVLAKGGADYLQPVPTYLITAVIKIFGPSLYNIRMVSVITVIISVVLTYFLGKELLGRFGGVISAIFLATTPIIMIQSHLAFDNVTPIPFIIAWLLTLYLYSKTKKIYYLVFSGLMLGVSFYSFKSMRIFVPMWTVLTLIYLAEDFLQKISRKSFSRVVVPITIFTVSILPFYAIIPWLEFQYAGAVLDNTNLAIKNIYSFINSYLANFDPSFLFIKGDELLFHSTRIHGMYLLASLPFFIFGIIYFWKKSSFWKFIIVALFAGPLLFGYIGQVHRANRLLAEIPLYSLVATGGFIHLLQKKSKIVLITLCFIFAFNYYDFVKYYWTDFGGDTKSLYTCYSCSDDVFKTLKAKSDELGLDPYIDKVNLSGIDQVRNFLIAVYFETPPTSWDGDKKVLPEKGILMTDNKDIGYLKQIGTSGKYYFYVNK